MSKYRWSLTISLLWTIAVFFSLFSAPALTEKFSLVFAGAMLFLSHDKKTPLTTNLLICSGLAIIYGLVSPFVSGLIETKGIGLTEILKYHWSSDESLFGAPLKIACRIIFPFALIVMFLGETELGKLAQQRFKKYHEFLRIFIPSLVTAIFLAAQYSQISWLALLIKILPLALITVITTMYISMQKIPTFPNILQFRSIKLLPPRQKISDVVIKTAEMMAPFTIAMALLGLSLGSFSISGLAPLISYALESFCKSSMTVVIILALAGIFLLEIFLRNIVLTFALAAILLSPMLKDLAAQNSFSLNITIINIFLLYVSAIVSALLPQVKFRLIKTGSKHSFNIGIGAESLKYLIIFIVLAIMIIIDQRLVLPDHFSRAALSFFRILAGIVIIATCMKGKLFTKISWRNTFLLIIIACTVLYPKAWINLFYPAYRIYSGDKIFEVAENIEPGREIKIFTEGMDELGTIKAYIFLLPLGDGTSGEDKLKNSGLLLRTGKDFAKIKKVIPESAAEDLGLDPEFIIKNVGVRQHQPNQYLPLIPAFLSFAAIAGLQWRRKKLAKE